MRSILQVVLLFIATSSIVVNAFQTLTISAGTKKCQNQQKSLTIHYATNTNRREVISGLALLTAALTSISSSPSLAKADMAGAEEDLTSKLFNADGSLKEGIEAEAKERKVEFTWDITSPSDDNINTQLLLNVDGENVSGTKAGSNIKLSYKVPAKWADGKGSDELYFDRSEGANVKACKGITVYQAPGKADEARLKKAATIGVAKALNVPTELSSLKSADIIGGRTTRKGIDNDDDDQVYYEFDMATAPATCESSSKENLGLGFCPYDNIYLLSAIVVDEKLYVISVHCDSIKQWKLANAELKRVRSSFSVEAVA